MAPPKRPSNLKYKALFNYRFFASPQEPIDFESPPFEALNDLHVHYDHPIVVSSNNIMIVVSIIDLG